MVEKRFTNTRPYWKCFKNDFDGDLSGPTSHIDVSKNGGFLPMSAEHVHRVDISPTIGPFFGRIWTDLPARSLLHNSESGDFTPQTAGNQR